MYDCDIKCHDQLIAERALYKLYYYFIIIITMLYINEQFSLLSPGRLTVPTCICSERIATSKYFNNHDYITLPTCVVIIMRLIKQHLVSPGE